MYAKILDKTYPRAAHIIAILGIKLLCDILKLIIESKPKIKITPNKPIIMEINFIIVNLSSFVIKWENINVKIGATDNNKPAVLDLIYISAQLIKEKGIKLPIKPIININIMSLKSRLE